MVKKFKVVISGDVFINKRAFEKVQETIKKFREVKEVEFEILSPKEFTYKEKARYLSLNLAERLAVFEHYTTKDLKNLEDQRLKAIAETDVFYVLGLGKLISMEVGYARALGKDTFHSESVSKIVVADILGKDDLVSSYCGKEATPSEIAVILLNNSQKNKS